MSPERFHSAINANRYKDPLPKIRESCGRFVYRIEEAKVVKDIIDRPRESTNLRH